MRASLTIFSTLLAIIVAAYTLDRVNQAIIKHVVAVNSWER
jgi:hypothetical protein